MATRSLPSPRRASQRSKLRIAVAVAVVVVLIVASWAYLRHETSGGNSSSTCGASFLTCRTNLSGTGTNFEAIDWPTVLLGVAFSNSSFDGPFLDQMHGLGIRTLAIETDPTFFSKYASRFSSLISEARSMGFRIHLINQLGYPSWYNLTGLAYPFARDPSFGEFESFELNATRSYAQFHPDLLSVIAEPGLMMQKIGATYTGSEWQSLLTTLCDAAKAVSASTETWVDLVPQNPFDDSLTGSLGPIASLDGIGLDLYGNVAPPAATAQMAEAIHSAGKEGGLTETWAFDLYGDPATDVASNVPAEATWLSPTGIVNYVIEYHLTGAFDPFFSGFFTSTSPLGNFTFSGLTEEASTYYTELRSGQATALYPAYQATITESA